MMIVSSACYESVTVGKIHAESSLEVALPGVLRWHSGRRYSCKKVSNSLRRKSSDAFPESKAYLLRKASLSNYFSFVRKEKEKAKCL